MTYNVLTYSRGDWGGLKRWAQSQPLFQSDRNADTVWRKLSPPTYLQYFSHLKLNFTLDLVASYFLFENSLLDYIFRVDNVINIAIMAILPTLDCMFIIRAGVGPLFSPGISGSRPAHFFHGIVEIG